MDRNTQARGQMALVGALAGMSCHLLSQLIERHMLGDREMLVLASFAAVCFTALLAMTGPLTLRRAAAGALGLASAVAALLWLSSFRHDTVTQYFASPLPAVAAVTLAVLPLPFLIAAQRRAWNDYATLFSESWTIVVRFVGAWLFVAVVWLVIFLSDALLSIVGLRIIEWLVDVPLVPWLITGVTLGLSLAVVTELVDAVSPFLVLRLLRLLVPVVLVVMAVFMLALPLRGLSSLFGALSVATTLLAMAGLAAMLVTTAVDQSDDDAVATPFMRTVTRALALMLPLPALLAGWAIGTRIAAYGWTPERLFGLVVALVALGYGAGYCVAVLRGAGWMGRIRQTNVAMALAVIALAALWLTPFLNAERISARDLLARHASGRTALAALDLTALGQWGRAGVAARRELEALARQPGQQGLSRALAGSLSRDGIPDDPVRALADLAAILPLIPAGATVERDRILAALAVDEVADWLRMCGAPLGSGGPGCVMVIADFWTELPGREAITFLREPGAYMRLEGLVEIDGMVQRRSVGALSGTLPDLAAGEAMIATLQAGGAVDIAAAPVNQLSVNGQALIVLP